MVFSCSGCRESASGRLGVKKGQPNDPQRFPGRNSLAATQFMCMVLLVGDVSMRMGVELQI